MRKNDIDLENGTSTPMEVIANYFDDIDDKEERYEIASEIIDALELQARRVATKNWGPLSLPTITFNQPFGEFNAMLVTPIKPIYKKEEDEGGYEDNEEWKRYQNKNKLKSKSPINIIAKEILKEQYNLKEDDISLGLKKEIVKLESILKKHIENL